MPVVRFMILMQFYALNMKNSRFTQPKCELNWHQICAIGRFYGDLQLPKLLTKLVSNSTIKRCNSSITFSNYEARFAPNMKQIIAKQHQKLVHKLHLHIPLQKFGANKVPDIKIKLVKFSPYSILDDWKLKLTQYEQSNSKSDKKKFKSKLCLYKKFCLHLKERGEGKG